MLTPESNNTPDIKGNYEIIWKDGPIKLAVSMVIWDVLSGNITSEMWYFLFVVTLDEESIKKAISIKEQNPKVRVMIIDLFWLSSRSMNSREIIEFSKLTKLPFVKHITETDSFLFDIMKSADEFREADEKWENNLEVTKAQIWYSSRILWYLKHDLPKTIIENWNSYKVDESKRAIFEKLIEDARTAFDMKSHVTESQVVRFIMDTKTQIEKVMEWEISWAYCDIDDTIIKADWTIIESTLLILENLEKEWKEIHIWTWGDMEMAKEKLTWTPFERFPLLSKYDYSGANAEIVIDNVSPEKFAIQTWITAKRFIRV
ncbi:MAG: hypothetical protein ACD_3C00136G0003 [uncultured bacterium (gcode 4)]|uniref:Uncharacterized protein n=1 Tax=uncultured bacterium (gcode 4) TaxID=1234023 RepID=K2G115_9BACT|nr:MAG: hypothetical protein ACD_3C00136G0003 [uncultured bacterium (gcode 4)]